MKAPRVDLRLAHGAETRRRVLARALAVAGAEGLEALTIGRLADDLGMSKAGVFGPFGSKEGLQLAVVDEARRDFVERVAMPALAEPEGVPRLEALCDRWLAWAGEREGGCFFAAAASEFDGRPGPVRDRIAATVQDWLDGLASVIEDARRLGHLRKDVDVEQLAFELHALELGGNATFQLLGRPDALQRARRAAFARIASCRVAGAPKAAPRGKKAGAPGRRE